MFDTNNHTLLSENWTEAVRNHDGLDLFFVHIIVNITKICNIYIRELQHILLIQHDRCGVVSCDYTKGRTERYSGAG